MRYRLRLKYRGCFSTSFRLLCNPKAHFCVQRAHLRILYWATLIRARSQRNISRRLTWILFYLLCLSLSKVLVLQVFQTQFFIHFSSSSSLLHTSSVSFLVYLITLILGEDCEIWRCSFCYSPHPHIDFPLNGSYIASKLLAAKTWSRG
jgi:hypothetical protein